jgi:hypothetical protein
MNELELMLQQAGGEIAWPATPDVASAVDARLRSEPSGAAGRRRFRGMRIGRPLAIALASLLVVAGGAAAVPGIRDPVLDFLGLRSVKVERVPKLPPAQPPPASFGERLGLGERTRIEAAQKQVHFTPGFPAVLGNPVVYVDETIPDGQLSLVYRGGKLLLMEVTGNLRFEFLQKFIPPGTRAERVVIQGERGLWITGRPHQVVFEDANGQIRSEATRLAGNVLVWRHKGLLMRLEGARSKAEALRIARSVGGAP